MVLLCCPADGARELEANEDQQLDYNWRPPDHKREVRRKITAKKMPITKAFTCGRLDVALMHLMTQWSPISASPISRKSLLLLSIVLILLLVLPASSHLLSPDDDFQPQVSGGRGAKVISEIDQQQTGQTERDTKSNSNNFRPPQTHHLSSHHPSGRHNNYFKRLIGAGEDQSGQKTTFIGSGLAPSRQVESNLIGSSELSINRVDYNQNIGALIDEDDENNNDDDDLMIEEENEDAQYHPNRRLLHKRQHVHLRPRHTSSKHQQQTKQNDQSITNLVSSNSDNSYSLTTTSPITTTTSLLIEPAAEAINTTTGATTTNYSIQNNDRNNKRRKRKNNGHQNNNNNNNNNKQQLDIKSQYNVKGATIIKVRESINLGATFINYTLVTNLNACLVECLITDHCDTAIYQESPVDFNSHLPYSSLAVPQKRLGPAKRATGSSSSVSSSSIDSLSSSIDISPNVNSIFSGSDMSINELDIDNNNDEDEDDDLDDGSDDKDANEEKEEDADEDQEQDQADDLDQEEDSINEVVGGSSDQWSAGSGSRFRPRAGGYPSQRNAHHHLRRPPRSISRSIANFLSPEQQQPEVESRGFPVGQAVGSERQSPQPLLPPPQPEGGGFFICFLFQCAKDEGYRCQFSSHNYYSSATKRTASRPAPTQQPPPKPGKGMQNKRPEEGAPEVIVKPVFTSPQERRFKSHAFLYSHIVGGLRGHQNPHLDFGNGARWHDTHLASIRVGQEQDFERIVEVGAIKSAIIALVFGVGVTGILIVIVSYKMKSIRSRMEYKSRRRSLVPDAEFLIKTNSHLI